MTDYAKPPVKPAWAEGGDRSDEPTNAEIQEGWPMSNTPPTRQRFNWLQNWFGNAIRYFMQMGIPHWDAADDYRLGSRVQTTDGKTWRALRANTNVQPGTSTADWVAWGDLDQDADINLYSVGAVNRFLRLNKGTSANPGAALKQWELGANTVGDLIFRAYDDTGVILGDALKFERSTGQMTLQDAAITAVTSDSINTDFLTVNEGLDMTAAKVENLGTGTAAGDAVNKGQMDTAIAASVANIGLSELRGFVWFSGGDQTANAGCTSAIVFVNSAWNRLVKTGAGITSRTLNIGTAGPVAGGRDQAAAFANGSDVHVYFIYNPTTDTVALTASLSASAPTLPAGYTYWAYATSVQLSGANIIAMNGLGSYMMMRNQIRNLSNGASITPTTIDAAFVPANARSIVYNFILEMSHASAGICNAQVRPTGGNAFFFALDAVAATSAYRSDTNTMELPVIGNATSFDYSISLTPGAGGVFVDMMGYTVANGDQ